MNFSIRIVFDRTELISEISRIISDANFSIVCHKAVCGKDFSVFNATLSANEFQNKNLLINRLKKIKGLKSIVSIHTPSL